MAGLLFKWMALLFLETTSIMYGNRQNSCFLFLSASNLAWYDRVMPNIGNMDERERRR
ncbi:hypothetical protein J31TS4_40200 [Paenibacillus sp. J31TS4]|nr:hypothetical protein J31TS4_40200 [Paenibacillus sp. J31TS4]